MRMSQRLRTLYNKDREKEKVRWSVRGSREKAKEQILVGIVGRG